MVEIQMFSPLPHQPPHSCPLALATPGHWRVPLMKICEECHGVIMITAHIDNSATAVSATTTMIIITQADPHCET
jgi:hypothetical protein